MNEAKCNRCGKLCRGAPSQKPDARMLKRAMTGECINCAVVTFLQRLMNMYSPNTFPDLPDALRLPHIQKQFEAVMRAGNAEAMPDEIDWEVVIANWNVGKARKDTLW